MDVLELIWIDERDVLQRACVNMLAKRKSLIINPVPICVSLSVS